jgi:hypothetical protein
MVTGSFFAWVFTDLTSEQPGRAESYGLVFGSIYGLCASVFGTRAVLDRLLDLDLV